MIITEQGQKKTEQVIFFSMEDFVPKYHLLRKTESAVDFSYLYSIEGYLSPEAVFIDGTHIKTDLNIKKCINKNIPKAAKVYEKQLM